MARRKRKDSSEGGLDSLMDAMTNVVGILVFVLILTQLGVGDAVEQMRQRTLALTPVSAEEYEAMKLRAAELDKLLAEALAAQSDIVLPEDTQSLLSLEDLEKKLKEIRGQLDDISLSDKKIAELKAEHERLLKEYAVLAAKVKGNKGRRDNLKLKLDQLADVETPADINIRMPTPRAAPAKKDGSPAEAHIFLVKWGKIYPVDRQVFVAYRDAFDQLPRAQRDSKNSGQVTRASAQKFLDVFNRKAESKGRNRNITYLVALGNSRIRMQMYPRANPQKGRSLKALKTKGRDRTIEKWFRAIKNQGDFVHLHVHTPDLADYVLLREMTEKLAVPTGWSFTRFDDERSFSDLSTRINHLLRLGWVNHEPTGRGGPHRPVGPGDID